MGQVCETDKLRMQTLHVQVSETIMSAYPDKMETKPGKMPENWQSYTNFALVSQTVTLSKH